MKKIFILSAVLALFSACNSNKDEWKLVWSDEFDGEQIDEAAWTRVPTGKDDWDDMMSLREDLAYVENGDMISIDIPNRSIVLEVADEVIAERKAKFVPPPPKATKGYLAKYAALATSADTGGVLRVK